MRRSPTYPQPNASGCESPAEKKVSNFKNVVPDIFGLEASELASLGAKRFHGKPPLISLGVPRSRAGGRVQAFAIIRFLFGRALRMLLTGPIGMSGGQDCPCFVVRETRRAQPRPLAYLEGDTRGGVARQVPFVDRPTKHGLEARQISAYHGLRGDWPAGPRVPFCKTVVLKADHILGSDAR